MRLHTATGPLHGPLAIDRSLHVSSAAPAAAPTTVPVKRPDRSANTLIYPTRTEPALHHAPYPAPRSTPDSTPDPKAKNRLPNSCNAGSPIHTTQRDDSGLLPSLTYSHTDGTIPQVQQRSPMRTPVGFHQRLDRALLLPAHLDHRHRFPSTGQPLTPQLAQPSTHASPLGQLLPVLLHVHGHSRPRPHQ